MSIGSPAKPVTIGLLWHSCNSDNLGIGALTAAHLAILDKVAGAVGVPVRYKAIGWKDRRAHYITRPDLDMAELRSRDLVKPNGMFAVARSCDLVLDIGAGDSFADIYGAKRFAKNLAAKLAVLAARRPLVLSPQTLGPFEAGWARRAALFVINRAHRVCTRDSLSTAFVKDIGFGGEVLEATDVAFRLPYDAPAPRADGKVRVGLNLSGLLLNGGYSGDNQLGLKGDYPALARALIENFLARDNCELHLVAHVISDSMAFEDDYRAAQALAGEFPGAVVAPRFNHPSEAKSYIAGLDFFTGSRMHACIAAFSSGVPVLPLAYSRKFGGLFGTLGYDELADCKTLTNDEIIARIDAAFASRAALKDKIAESLARAEARLDRYETMLGELLVGVAGGRA